MSAPAAPEAVHRLRKPYLLFLGDVDHPAHAKTAAGVRDWTPDDCVAQWRLPGCRADLDLPELRPAAAAAAGARSMLIGVAVTGGRIPAHWLPMLHEAIDAGLDLVAGLHTRLAAIPELVEAAGRRGTRLVDVRVPPADLPVGTGLKRRGKRLLTVGSDCALGKKYTALALARAMRARGVDAEFRATGQTGILIAGRGVPLDAVVADFIAGAAEALTPDAGDDHWDVIEGQGSIVHPAYAGVTLGLLHGSQPDALVLCHDPTRTHIGSSPHVPIPPLDELARRYLEAGRLTNPAVRLAGVALNTSALDAAEGDALIAATAAALGVPCFDPLRTPADAVVDSVLRA
ncbi:DUF1611 domain-containing protein [Luteimonas sp. Y-2-2-4F]|nr:DUF1611 domain-containing protein [Luteimonas sp. Y-2-2-4F]MCD9032044.1 DUF1611 domain-containing protein [Luteimonas sp. Y-2-2-4F]